MRGHASRLIYLFCLFVTGPLLAQQAAPAAPGPSLSPAQPSTTASAVFGTITGSVKSGASPLPGVTVTAANTLTGKKYITSTDVDGSFKIEVGSKGRYVVRAEFSAFAPVTQEVLINAETPAGRADLAMVLLSRAQRAEQQQQAQTMQGAGGANRTSGLQQLALSAGGMGGAMASGGNDMSSAASAGLPNAGLAAEGTNESVAVSGAMGRNEQPTFDPGEMQDRIADMRDQMARQGGGQTTFQSFNGGGPGGFGGGGGNPMIFIMGGGPGGFGGGGRGGRSGFNINKPHGSIFYNFDGSALDARPFSLNGAPSAKADYSQDRFGITMGGPLNIPHIYNGGTKTFLFGSYTGTRGNNPFDAFSTVPTLAERAGDFSGSAVVPRDPSTGLPFANGIVPLNPIAAQLLAFIPQPNLPGTQRNFHFVSSSPSDTDTAFVRFNHNFGADQGMFGMFGPRAGAAQRRRQQEQQQNSSKDKDDKSKSKSHWAQSINGGFNYNNIRNAILNPFPSLGGNLSTHNYNGNIGYTLSKGLFLNSLRFNYNNSAASTLNNFTNINNIEGVLGINGVSQLPADFGLPTLSFAPEFTSLQDTSPQFRTTQNYSLGDSMSWTHGKHSWTWGADYRHQLLDISNATNARGTFQFTGGATGLPFADFLLGITEQTSVQFGADNYHFRADSFDLYVQDNWRAGKNLTLNLGLRYEYVPPYAEADNRLANLDVAPGFTAVAPVLAGQKGPLTGLQYSNTLINPDRNNFAPRLGLAWKPLSKTVVRAGYGVNYNLSQYGTLATQLGFQPPFAVAETIVAPDLTLENPFAATSRPVTNNYAVDPNYRLAYVQSWNLNIQQEVRSDLVVNVGYTGSKGTHLDIVRAPSLDSSSLLGTAQPFLFESSNGSSILHAGSIRVRKRMKHGLSLGGTYTYSKSIDNASSIGGGAVVVAQNDLNLAAERGLSSFDQRHRLTADYYYELPFGKDKMFLNNNSWEARGFGGFSLSGNVTVASGFPFSPRVFGGFSDLARGTNGSLRPDVVPGQSITVSDPTIGEFFNTAAFSAPSGQFGDAGRDIIIGPGTFSVDMAVSKTVQLKETQNLELRLSATNVFNHVNFSSIDATLGSPTFGQVISVGSMRKAQITARYRF
jgi:hypothetical protein